MTDIRTKTIAQLPLATSVSVTDKLIVWQDNVLKQTPATSVGEIAFASIASLRANTVAYGVNQNVFVKAYYAGGTTGGGVFIRIAGTAADNGGTIIADAAGQRWERAGAGNVASVLDFGASPTASAAVNTTSIQAAIDYIYAKSKGGVVEIVGTYNISTFLTIGRHIKLEGPGTLIQTTSNTPIIVCNKDLFMWDWGVRDLNLEYATQQTTSDTNARALVVCVANSFSWNFQIENVNIFKAYKGVDAPDETSSFAFLATFTNVNLSNCAGVHFNWENATTGGGTFLTLNNVYANGSGLPGGSTPDGFVIKRTSLTGAGIATDWINGRPMYFETCYGGLEIAAIESCSLTGNGSAFKSALQVSGGLLDFKFLHFVSNTFVLNDTSVGALLRVVDNAVVSVNEFRENANTVTGASAGNMYTALGQAGIRLTNVVYTRVPAGANPTPNAYFNDFVLRPNIERWDGVDRLRRAGGKEQFWTTSIPASGTWAVGDVAWNTDPTTSDEPIGWVCTVTGSPGTWFPFGAPTHRTATATAIAAVGNAVNTAGKFAGVMVWDTTNNRLMRANGGGAADPWWVVDGSASVTPS